MTPSQQCKAAGLKSLAEVSRISRVSEQTLINWHKNKPRLFATLVVGAVVIKAANADMRGCTTLELNDEAAQKAMWERYGAMPSILPSIGSNAKLSTSQRREENP